MAWASGRHYDRDVWLFVPIHPVDTKIFHLSKNCFWHWVKSHHGSSSGDFEYLHQIFMAIHPKIFLSRLKWWTNVANLQSHTANMAKNIATTLSHSYQLFWPSYIQCMISILSPFRIFLMKQLSKSPLTETYLFVEGKSLYWTCVFLERIVLTRFRAVKTNIHINHLQRKWPVKMTINIYPNISWYTLSLP